jgi:hypothetical protein
MSKTKTKTKTYPKIFLVRQNKLINLNIIIIINWFMEQTSLAIWGWSKTLSHNGQKKKKKSGWFSHPQMWLKGVV